MRRSSRDQVVDKRLVYMTPEWKDAFRHATELADRLGLEQAIAGSPGWSESGGPWVRPAQAMKKLVWTETVVEGGRPVTAPLPTPPSATGPFQNAPRVDVIAALSGQPPARQPEHYQDIAVMAFRVPTSDVSLMTLQPVVTSSGGTIDAARLVDGDYAKAVSLPVTSDGTPAWIQFEFASPQRDSRRVSRARRAQVALRAAATWHRPRGERRRPHFQEGRDRSSQHGRTEHRVIRARGRTRVPALVSGPAPDRIPRERCAPAAASGQEP